MAMHFEKEKMSIMHFQFIFVKWVKLGPRETFLSIYLFSESYWAKQGYDNHLFFIKLSSVLIY